MQCLLQLLSYYLRHSLKPPSWELAVQMFVMTSTTTGHSANSAFAIPWSITRPQAIKTQSELLRIFSSFNQCHYNQFLKIPDGVQSVFEWAFKFLWFCRIFSVCCKCIRIRFLDLETQKLLGLISLSVWKLLVHTNPWIKSNLVPLVNDAEGVTAPAL